MIKRHIMTFGKDAVMSENFSDTEKSNQKMYVLRSDVSYDRGKTPSAHISLGGMKSLFEDLSYTEPNYGEVSGGKFISSVSVLYFDESVKGFRKLLIHNSKNLLDDLENFISSLEGSTKNTTTIITFNGGDLDLTMEPSKIPKCIFSRYKTSFPLPLFDRPDLFPKNNDGSFKNFDVSYILVICARSKNMLFDSFKIVPKANYDSTKESNTERRLEFINELYIKLNEDVPPKIDTSDKSTTKLKVEYLNVFGLSVGRYNDDMVVHNSTNKNLIATFGKDIKYYKEHLEIKNSR